MQINQAKFNAIVEAAKTKAADSPAWLRAIEKAAAGILDGSLIVTTLAHGALVTGKNGSHHANGRCDCEASRRGHSQCYHRAAARLMHNYETAAAVSPAEVLATKAATSDGAQRRGDRDLQHLDRCQPHGALADDIAATPRKQLIIEIENVWPETWPPIFRELLARFGKSHLHMLDDDQLRRVRLAIAA